MARPLTKTERVDLVLASRCTECLAKWKKDYGCDCVHSAEKKSVNDTFVDEEVTRG